MRYRVSATTRRQPVGDHRRRAPYGGVPVVGVEVGPAGLAPGGSVEVRSGSQVLATASGAPGRRRIALPARLLAPGTTPLRVVYVDPAGRATATADTSAVVSRLTSVVDARRTVVTRGERGRVAVTLAVVPGGAADLATGKVTIKSGKRVLGTGRVVDGRVVVRLWKLKRVGKVTARISYAGTDFVSGDTGTVSLVVRR